MNTGKHRKVKAPIVIGRDHLDTGSGQPEQGNRVYDGWKRRSGRLAILNLLRATAGRCQLE